MRGSVVATAMARLVIADMMFLNASSKIEKFKENLSLQILTKRCLFLVKI